MGWRQEGRMLTGAIRMGRAGRELVDGTAEEHLPIVFASFS